MKIFKSHFWYNKRQRNGILFLLLFLLLIQLGLYFSNFSDLEYIDEEEFAHMEAKIDSLKNLNSKILKPKIYLFNPNYLSDFKAYSIGLSVDQTDKLFAFRQQGNFVNSAADFQEVTGVSDSLLSSISPLFKFPKWLSKNTKQAKPNEAKKRALKIKDLNQVSHEELTLIKGVGSKLARRILSYKNLLKAYSLNEQLYEVYYLDRKIADRILQYYHVIDTPYIAKLDINSASFKQLLAIPYIDYELTKKIVNYRDENLLYRELEELKKIDSFPLDRFHRIALYLTAE